MARISDETLAIAIPAALKTDHPDSAIVVQGIVIALAASENSGSLTAKGRMRDVHDALQSVYVPIYQAHLQKEDEDWGALNDRVKMAESPPVNINTGTPEDVGDTFQWKGQASDGTFWLVNMTKEGHELTAKVFSESRNHKLATASGDTPVLAIINAYKVTGKRAEVSVPEPAPIPETIPAPTVDPIPEPESDDELEPETGDTETYRIVHRYQRSGKDTVYNSLESAKEKAIELFNDGKGPNGPGARGILGVSILNSGGKRVATITKDGWN